MNATVAPWDCPKYTFTIIVPVDAIMHRLGNGVMPYLLNLGVRVEDLVLNAIEMVIYNPNYRMPLDDCLTVPLQTNLLNHQETLEYNNLPFDTETLTRYYVETSFIFYDVLFEWVSPICRQNNIHSDDSVFVEIDHARTYVSRDTQLPDSLFCNITITQPQ